LVQLHKVRVLYGRTQRVPACAYSESRIDLERQAYDIKTLRQARMVRE